MQPVLLSSCDGLGRQGLAGGRSLADRGAIACGWSCFLVVAGLALPAPAGCSISKGAAPGVGTGPGSTIPAAAAPRITPWTNAWSSPIVATITCSSPGSISYLTTDGSTPTSSSIQSGSASFKTSGTLNAICAGGGYSASPVVSATYAIIPDATVTHGFAIPIEHPRLWFTPDRLAAARSWWKAHSYTPSNDYLQSAFAHVASNGVLSCRTKEGGNTLSAIDYALGNPAAVSQDHARWEGDIVIIVYDWCYDELTAREKTRIENDTHAWLTRRMNDSWGGPSMFQNNYFWGTLRNEIDWAIASYYENTTDGEIFLNDALDTRWAGNFIPAVATTTAGGVFQEGPEYGVYIPYYSAVPFTTVQLNGRDIYGESTFFKSAVLHTIYTTLPALTTSTLLGTTGYEVFPFGDSHREWRGGNSALSRVWIRDPGSFMGDWMQLMAEHWASINIGKYAQQWVNMVGMGALVSYWVQAFPSSTKPLAFPNLPLDYFATGMKFFYVRKAWDTSSTVLHLQLGAPSGGAQGHGHMDHGNWQMWRGGRWLARESSNYGCFNGCETIAGYGGSGSIDAEFGAGHNVVLVNPDNQGCKPGVSCANGGSAVWIGNCNAPPTVSRLETQAGYAYAESDISGTYRNNKSDPGRPELDNPAVKTVLREYVFVRDIETLVIFDRLEANPVGTVPAASIKKVFLEHCEAPWTMEDSQHSTCTNGPQALRLTTLVPALSARKSVTEGNPGVGQYRLEVTDSGSAQSYFLHVLQARAATDGNLSPSVVDKGSSYVVTLDRTHSLVFNKGMTSTGGSITISGNARNFRTDVQSISYTDSGPVWK